ncbi:MAG: hypothetical protein HY043_10280 [Verrucomicrobia bacterium]|nr:hypothetical protein [Verrucomicrobiota bacterium]
MNKRALILGGVLFGLGLLYVLLFTEWIRPEPIQIASQVRASLIQPRFGRPVTQRIISSLAPPKGDVLKMTNITVGTNLVVRTNQPQRVQLSDWGQIDQAPGGVANVTFSLDGNYILTSLRVQDVPADGSPPKILWQLAGKSLPLSFLLYGRDPQGMKPTTPDAKAEPLSAGVPYRLIVEAGRRHGTNDFKTTPAAAR